MLAKSGFSLRNGGSTDKGSVLTSSSREFKGGRSIAGTTSMITDDNESLFRDSDVEMRPMASHTRASLDLTATLVSLGESRGSFGDHWKQSVPNRLGAGESGFAFEEGEEHGNEATPTSSRRQGGDQEQTLHDSRSTLGGSFGYKNYQLEITIINPLNIFSCSFHALCM